MTRFNLTLLSALLALGLGCGTEEDIQPVDGSDGIRVGEVDVSPQAPGQGPDVIPADDGAPNVVETPVEAPARGDEARDEVPPSDAPHGDQADPAPGGDSRGDGAGDRRAEDDAHDGQGHVRPHDGADDDMNPDQADDRPRDVPEGDAPRDGDRPSDAAGDDAQHEEEDEAQDRPRDGDRPSDAPRDGARDAEMEDEAQDRPQAGDRPSDSPRDDGQDDDVEDQVPNRPVDDGGAGDGVGGGGDGGDGAAFPLLSCHNIELANDPFGIEELRIVGDVLQVRVSYSGGCVEHSFGACAGGFQERVPVSTTLHIGHSENEDPCDGITDEWISIDLSELRVLYQQRFHAEEGVILLNLPQVAAPLEYVF